MADNDLPINTQKDGMGLKFNFKNIPIKQIIIGFGIVLILLFIGINIKSNSDLKKAGEKILLETEKKEMFQEGIVRGRTELMSEILTDLNNYGAYVIPLDNNQRIILMIVKPE